MKNDALENLILLHQSGELSDSCTHDLNTALSSNPEANEYRDEIDLVVDRARESLATGNPSPHVIRAIRAAGETHAEQRGRFFFPQALIQRLAYAGLIVIMAGGWFLFARDNRGDRILEMQALVAAANDEVRSPQEAVPDEEDDEQLRALARQLLLMEGLDFDDGTSSEHTAGGITTDVAPSPTVLRGRSTGAHPAQKHV